MATTTPVPTRQPAATSRASSTPTAEPNPLETEAPQPEVAPYAYWARIGGLDDAPSFESVEAIVAEADTVIVGTVVGLIETREIPLEETGETMYMFGVEVKVDEIIAGKLVPGTANGNLIVESVLGFAPAPQRFEAFSRSTPVGEQVLLFLWHKGEDAKRRGMDPNDRLAGETYYVMLGGLEGYIRNVAEKADVSPDAEGRWIKDLAGRPFAEIVRQARAASSE